MTKHDEKRARRIRHRTRLNKKYRDEARALSNVALGEKFDVHPKHVSRIISDRHWLKRGGRNFKINYEDAELIRAAAKERDRLKSLAAEHSHARIAADEGCSLVLVNEISMGKKWRSLSNGTENPECAE